MANTKLIHYNFFKKENQGLKRHSYPRDCLTYDISRRRFFWRSLLYRQNCFGQCITFILKNNYWRWWEHSPPTTDQCGRGSNPGVDAVCGLSLLLVLSLNLRGFSPGTPVFSSPQKPTRPKSSSIWNARTRLNKFLRTPRCFVAKQIAKQTNMIATTWRLSVHQPA